MVEIAGGVPISIERGYFSGQVQEWLSSAANIHRYMKFLQQIHPFFFILIATILEVCGDAIIRTSIYNRSGSARIGLMAVGAVLLFGYGSALNLAPVEFGKIVGLYIATLFVVWQVITYFTSGTTPTAAMMVGGLLIVAGGLIVTFWKD